MILLFLVPLVLAALLGALYENHFIGRWALPAVFALGTLSGVLAAFTG